jgi:hypothetical protein
MMLPAILWCAPLLLPQGLPAPMAPALSFGEDAARGASFPVVDNQNQPFAPHASHWVHGSFDGDRNLDLALVTGATATTPGTLSILSAKGHDLGRFRRLHTVAGTLTSTVTAAARQRSTGYVSPGGHPADHLLYAERQSSWLTALYWNFSNAFPGYSSSPAYLQVGTGVREMRTADLDHNGHDDIYLLRDDTASGVTELARYPFTGSIPYGTPVPGQPTILRVPLRLELLVPADLDGDRQGDAIVYAPGIGLLGLVHHEPTHTFVPLWLVRCPRPLSVRTGQFGSMVLPDQGPVPIDLAVTYASEAFVVRCLGSVLRVLHRVVPLPGEQWQDAALCDGTGEGTPDLVMQNRALDALTIFPALQSGIGAPVRTVPGHSTVAWLGGGAPGDATSLLPVDVDEDGDQDLLFLHPALDRFVCVRNTGFTLRPTLLSIRNDGLAGPNLEYLQQTVMLTVPTELQAVTSQLELVIYRRNSQSTPSRLSLPIDYLPGSSSVQIRLYYFRTRQPGDAQGLGVVTHDPTDQTPVLNGDCFVSVHGWQQGGRRFESTTLGRSYAGGDQTAMSIRWEVSAPPPLFDIDDERLPW